MKNNNRKANALIIVILILAVIFIAGMFFGFHTTGQTRNTERAIGGDQAASLADAGLNRAMRVVSAEINSSKAFEPGSPSDRLSVILRYPLPVISGDSNKLNPELGDDLPLDVSILEKEGLKNKFEYTKEQLIADDTNGILEGFVKYAGFEKVKDWDLNVTVEIESAYKITPKSVDGEEYQVPGIDVAYAVPPAIKEFLDNKGIPNIIFEFPKEIKLLDFTIPFTLHVPLVGDITLAKIDPVQFFDVFIKKMTEDTDLAGAFDMRSKGVGLGDISRLHNLLHALFNNLLDLPDVYPIKMSSHDEGDFFTSKDKLWPSSVKVPSDMSRFVEKYGTLKVTSKSEITFINGTKSSRRVSATKDFKVSDIMPMAPIHSFFIANTGNECINFNDLGGQIYVNNNASRVFSKDEIKKRKDHSGQVRVNYLPGDASNGDTSTDCPLVVNCSLIGDTDGPKLANNNFGDGMLNLVAGNDAALMLGSTSSMSVTNAKYNMDWTINSETVKKKNADGKKVPAGVKLKPGKLNTGFQLDTKVIKNIDKLSTKPTYLENRDKYKAGGLKKYHDKQRLWNQEDFRILGKTDDKLDGLAKWKKEKAILNFLPDVEDTSSNIFGFGAAMIKRPFGFPALNLDKLGITFGSAANKNSFLEFELPYMGTANSNYCLPTFGTGQNKTHLFGTSSWNPTLTRDIEGPVAKRYRQWRVTILGLLARDRLPLLPFTPPFCNVPPIPIPYWWVDTKITKYDYDIFCLKAYDVEKNQSDTSYSIYDPSMMENMPANWYTNEQYAKKSNYFYKDYQGFIDDLPNRMVDIDGKKVLQLNGVTYISGSIGGEAAGQAFKPEGSDTLYVTGKGMIVCSGNIILNCNIKYVEVGEEPTVFSLIARNGGLVIAEKGEYVIQGSVYTNRCIYLGGNTKLNIQGNWVTNEYVRTRMMGDLLIDYVSSYLRPSMGSLHPETGKYDPRRYNLAMAQKWNSWKVD